MAESIKCGDGNSLQDISDLNAKIRAISLQMRQSMLRPISVRTF